MDDKTGGGSFLGGVENYVFFFNFLENWGGFFDRFELVKEVVVVG